MLQINFKGEFSDNRSEADPTFFLNMVPDQNITTGSVTLAITKQDLPYINSLICFLRRACIFKLLKQICPGDFLVERFFSPRSIDQNME